MSTTFSWKFVKLILWFLSLIISSNDAATVLFFQNKLDKQLRVQPASQPLAMPGTVWTHFQCDPKVSPFIGVGFGCYCPGAWCSMNNQCCSQMCYKKTCY